MKNIDAYILEMAISKLKEASRMLKQGGMPAKSMRIDAIISDAEMTIKENSKENK